MKLWVKTATVRLGSGSWSPYYLFMLLSETRAGFISNVSEIAANLDVGRQKKFVACRSEGQLQGKRRGSVTKTTQRIKG